MKEVMLDLETLGTKPGCVILSIGAVFFDSEKIGEKFYEIIDIQNSCDLGFNIEAQTVLWWIEQKKEALELLSKKGKKVIDVLKKFNYWISSNASDQILLWGNGSDFDNVILDFAYNKISYKSLNKPWGKFSNRCYRTIKNEFPEIEIKRVGVHHNALDDAINQANHLIEIRKFKHSFLVNNENAGI